jgi:hypothetical protein
MSSMIESLTQTRHAERYSGSQGTVVAHGGTPVSRQSTRTRAGWLLVGLGLRLALPSRQHAARRITLIGR